MKDTKTIIYSIRLTPSQHEAFKDYAKDKGKTSKVLRDILLKQIAK